jgi:predicted transcriptional regulator
VENGELLGIVSRRDILKAMNEYYEMKCQDRDRQKHPPQLTEMIQQRLLVTGQ